MRHFFAVATRVTIRHLWIKNRCIILLPLMESTFSKLSATVILHSATVKLYVSFAKEPYKRDYILQKRPIVYMVLQSFHIVLQSFCLTYGLTHENYKSILRLEI